MSQEMAWGLLLTRNAYGHLVSGTNRDAANRFPSSETLHQPCFSGLKVTWPGSMSVCETVPLSPLDSITEPFPRNVHLFNLGMLLFERDASSLWGEFTQAGETPNLGLVYIVLVVTIRENLHQAYRWKLQARVEGSADLG